MTMVSVSIFLKSENTLTYAGIPLRYLPKRKETYVHTNVCKWTVFIAALFPIVQSWHNPMSVNRWMEKQTVVHPYDGILHGNKKGYFSWYMQQHGWISK